MTSDMPAFLKRLAPMVLFGARLAALTFWTTAAVAQQNGLQTLNTGDEARGWEAVGRVDITGKGFCTGTLIETDLVLTAAHCLYAPDGTAQVQSNDIQFRAGLRNGRPETERGARGFMVHPDYDPTDPDKTSRLRYDVALIVLDRPIGAAQIAPFDVSTNGLNGRDIGVVSYGQGREEAPSLEDLCQIKAAQDGVMIMDCTVAFGSSGAPVFRYENGAAKLVSVVSAMAEVNGKAVSLAPDLTEPLPFLLSQIGSLQNRLSGTPSGTDGLIRRIRPGERNDTGALFLRP